MIGPRRESSGIRHRARVASALALAGALVAWVGCAREDPLSVASGPSGDASPAIASPPDDAQAPAASGEASPAAPRAAAPPAAAEPAHVPLESLLRQPRRDRAESGPIDLRAPEAGAPDEPAAPGVVERWKDNVRVERRSQAIGPAGPRQGTHSETEAGLRVPIDDAVDLEGGVRVDQRDEPGAEEADRRSTPRVGVEVRF